MVLLFFEVYDKKLALRLGLFLWSCPSLNWIIALAHLCSKGLGASLRKYPKRRTQRCRPEKGPFKTLEDGTLVKREMTRTKMLWVVRLCIKGRANRRKNKLIDLNETDFSPSIL